MLHLNVSELKRDQVSGLAECFSDDCFPFCGWFSVVWQEEATAEMENKKPTLAQEPNYNRILLKCYTERTKEM